MRRTLAILGLIQLCVVAIAAARAGNWAIFVLVGSSAAAIAWEMQE